MYTHYGALFLQSCHSEFLTSLVWEQSWKAGIVTNAELWMGSLGHPYRVGRKVIRFEAALHFTRAIEENGSVGAVLILSGSK